MKNTEKEKVLIIDDSTLNRSILMDMLGENYEIFEAGNGEDGLKLIWKYGRDLSMILLDLIMPKMNGFEVLEEMNRCGWMITTIPVIVISTEKDNRSLNRAFDLGAVDFIERPFNIYSVQRRVKNALSFRRKEKRLQRSVQEGIHRHVNRVILLLEMLAGTEEAKSFEEGKHPEMTYLVVHELMDEVMRNPHQKQYMTPDEIDDAAMAAILYPAVDTDLLAGISRGREEQLLHMMEDLAAWKRKANDGAENKNDKEDEPLWIQIVDLSELLEKLLYGTSHKAPVSFRDAERVVFKRYQNAFDRSVLDAFESLAGKISVQMVSKTPQDTLRSYLEHIAQERYEDAFSVKT